MSIIGKAESISHGRAAVKYAEEKQINGGRRCRQL